MFVILMIAGYFACLFMVVSCVCCFVDSQYSDLLFCVFWFWSLLRLVVRWVAVFGFVVLGFLVLG